MKGALTLHLREVIKRLQDELSAREGKVLMAAGSHVRTVMQLRGDKHCNEVILAERVWGDASQA